MSEPRQSRRGLAAAAAGMALVVVGISAAASGDLDPSFGGDGIVTVDVGRDVNGEAVVVQADGKVVIAGWCLCQGSLSTFVLARVNPDGSLDATFGGDGIVTTSIADSAAATALVVQEDGKLVAAGHSCCDEGDRDDFALARYNADGSLDTSFGGDGIVVTPIGGGDEGAEALAVQADGKLVAAGWDGVKRRPRIALVRYNPDGSLDASFGGDGTVTTRIKPRGGRADAVAVQEDGKIVAAGTAVQKEFERGAFALVRANPDGTLDPSFGRDGIVTTRIDLSQGGSRARALVVQSDGKLVAAGVSAEQFALARYNADGTLDPSFGGTGKVKTDFGPYAEGSEALVVQQDGKLVAAGLAWNETDADFALARYSPDGTLDPAFGGDGRITTHVRFDYARAIALQQDGKLVAGGYVFPLDGRWQFALARYEG
jgi:uncharacterized delta-60 repeat protein